MFARIMAIALIMPNVIASCIAHDGTSPRLGQCCSGMRHSASERCAPIFQYRSERQEEYLNSSINATEPTDQNTSDPQVSEVRANSMRKALLRGSRSQNRSTDLIKDLPSLSAVTLRRDGCSWEACIGAARVRWPRGFPGTPCTDPDWSRNIMKRGAGDLCYLARNSAGGCGLVWGTPYTKCGHSLECTSLCG